MSTKATDHILTLSVETARFYGGLVANGVPAAQAATIASEYMRYRVVVLTNPHLFPEPKPWEDQP